MDKPLPQPEQVFRMVPCLCGVLQIAARSVARLYNEEMRATGMEANQYTMLMLLEHFGAMTLGDLGARMSVDKTTISRTIKLMERHRWVVVERGEDARERIATITKLGLSKAVSARPYWHRAQARMQAALRPGHFESLRAALPDLAVAALNG